jgi:hypothetical protein
VNHGGGRRPAAIHHHDKTPTMRLPEKNSRGETILAAFLKKGAMTIYQGAEEHGEFATSRVPGGIDHAKMVELYCDLVDRGCLVREGIKYRLSLAAQQQLERKAAAPEARSIVPPRVRNFLANALFVGYSPFSPRRISL